MADMNEVIADAVDDAAFDAAPDTTVDTSSAETVDTPAEGTEPSVFSEEGVAAEATAAVTPVASDDFEKRWGISAKSVTGRENRIPHSRVKQMVTKAEADAIAKITKELEGKHTGVLTPLETKVKDYESRLEKVAQFENVLENDPRTFLSMLAQVPAYKEFFENYTRLVQAEQAGGAQPQPKPTLDHSDMPQPDQVLSDGSKVYSLEGLALRDEWLAKKIEERAVRQAEDRFSQRYAPIEQEWQQQQRYNQMVPVIEKQIAEARQWPNFSELEPEIIKILKADQRTTLEKAYVQAYQQHVVPKLTTDHNKVRTAVLAELRKQPVASSAPAAQVKPAANTLPENASMEEVIRESLRKAGLIE